MALIGLVEASMLKEVLIQMMFKQRESIVPAWPYLILICDYIGLLWWLFFGWSTLLKVGSKWAPCSPHA